MPSTTLRIRRPALAQSSMSMTSLSGCSLEPFPSSLSSSAISSGPSWTDFAGLHDERDSGEESEQNHDEPDQHAGLHLLPELPLLEQLGDLRAQRRHSSIDGIDRARGLRRRPLDLLDHLFLMLLGALEDRDPRFKPVPVTPTAARRRQRRAARARYRRLVVHQTSPLFWTVSLMRARANGLIEHALNRRSFGLRPSASLPSGPAQNTVKCTSAVSTPIAASAPSAAFRMSSSFFGFLSDGISPRIRWNHSENLAVRIASSVAFTRGGIPSAAANSWTAASRRSARLFRVAASTAAANSQRHRSQ